MTYYGINYDSSIQHHGILGMKWGIRRYQNADGTLTDRGKKRYAKVASSKYRSTLETQQARNIMKKNAKKYKKDAEIYKKSAIKQKEKAQETFDETKSAKHREKAKEYFRMANQLTKQVKIANRFINDLDSGKKKAGRDFIVQSDTYFNPLLIPGVGGFVGITETKRIIERP